MKKLTIRDLSLISINLCVLIISSKIAIPFTFIPFTLQTLSVFIISLLLKTKKAAITFGIYVLMGLMGFPIFSKGGGIHYVFEPSFGFILGFLFASLTVGQTNESKSLLLNMLLILSGLVIIYVCGSIYMYIVLLTAYSTNPSISYVLSIAVFPFIIKDILSIILAIIIYSRIKNLNNS